MNILFKPEVELIAMSYPVWQGMSGVFPKNDADNLEQIIEVGARNCYKSEISKDTTARAKFVDKIVNVNHHESVAEHASITFKITTRRDVLAELTRHRLASYSVESQRYVNYSEDKTGGAGIRFMCPTWLKKDLVMQYLEDESFEPKLGTPEDLQAYTWVNFHKAEEINYNELLELGCKPEQARDVLSNAVATTIVITANVREWKHILELRRAPSAYSEIRVVMEEVFKILNKISPTIFKHE
jgi:thymidylate synthase (FAD)